MKSVEIRSFLWSIFSCIWAEYENLLRNTKINYFKTFYAVRLYHNLQFRLPIFPSLQWVLLTITISRQVLFCKKVVFTNFAKFTRKHQKRDSGTDVFL